MFNNDNPQFPPTNEQQQSNYPMFIPPPSSHPQQQQYQQPPQQFFQPQPQPQPQQQQQQQPLQFERKSNMSNYQGVQAVGFIPAMQNLLTQIKLMSTDAETENAFLKRELSENTDLLNSFIEDFDKVNKLLSTLNTQLQKTKSSINESRNQISIEKEKIARYEMDLKLSKEELQKHP